MMIDFFALPISAALGLKIFSNVLGVKSLPTPALNKQKIKEKMFIFCSLIHFSISRFVVIPSSLQLRTKRRKAILIQFCNKEFSTVR